MVNYFDVSVLVVMYRPDLEKLKHTLTSILNQKGVSYQIIVTDDGSEDNLFHHIKYMFEKKGFLDFKLIYNTCNLGTVNNIHNALDACQGKYIKTLSPGDMFCSENSLKDWLNDLKHKKSVLSFCNAVYFHFKFDGKMEAAPKLARPQCLSVYSEGGGKIKT